MSAHTPGPWKAGNVENRTGGRSAVLIWADGGDDLGEARTFADARLMAAAPELLEALERMVAMFADHTQYDEEGYETAAVAVARAAIAKAKGN